MNDLRGETPLAVRGTVYNVRLTTNVMANLEVILDAAGFELIEVLRRGGIRAIRGVLRAVLSTPQKADRPESAPMPALTDQGMGELMDEMQPEAYRIAYWLLLANGGIFRRDVLEEAGLLPKSGRTVPKEPGDGVPPSTPSGTDPANGEDGTSPSSYEHVSVGA